MSELTFNDAVRMARGCHDYSGGHHHDGHYDAFHHGVQTVINVLESAEKNGMDTQCAVLWRIGKSHNPEGEKERVQQ